MPEVKCHKCGELYDCRPDEYMGLCYSCEPRPFRPYVSAKSICKDKVKKGADGAKKDKAKRYGVNQDRLHQVLKRAAQLLTIWELI